METIKQYAPLALLAAYTIKTIVTGAQISDSLVVLSLTGLVGINHYLNITKFKSNIQDKLDTHSLEISKLYLTLEAQDKEIKEAKSYVSSIKLQNSFRPKTG